MAIIFSLFLVHCSIYDVPLSFLRMRLLSERKYLSITHLTAMAQKNYSCVMGMIISFSDSFLMAELSIWCVVLIDINNAFCAWEFLMMFQVIINRLHTPPSTNSDFHYHDTYTICSTLAIYKYD